ncbi:MAG: hypothetical protein GQ564_15030 [Bacteroidales bacterium]|nr:hypothetical protein [Bacteroidales bacterium]
MKYRIVLFIGLIIISYGCDDFQWDLTRDNPLDDNFDKENNEIPTPARIEYKSYEITSDDNNDNFITKGETIDLKVYLKNTGGATANAVKVTFQTNSPNASIISTSSDISYGNMTANSEVAGQYYYYDYSLQFKVSDSAPVNTSIIFFMNISDEAGNTWTDNFSIIVQEINSNIIYSKNEITSDDNNDNYITKGETVGLKVYLKNTGTSTALSVSAEITTSSSYATVLSSYSDVSYGDMAANSEVAGQFSYYDYSLQFKVSDSAPVNTSITFTMNISDEAGNTWTDNFSITVQEINSNIIYLKNEIYSDDNNDNYITKGETVGLEVYLKNTGTSTALSVSAEITTSSSYATVLSSYSDVSYGDMTANSEVAGQYSYYDYSLQFKVSDSAPVNTSITFTINISDEFGNTWVDNFSVTVQEINSTIVYLKNEVFSDDNSNDLINSGETIGLDVYLKNTGTSTALSVSAEFTTSSSYATVLSSYSDVSYGDMAANSEVAGQYSYYDYSLQFKVSDIAPVGTNIPFTVNISDEFGNAWTDNFSITVE